MSALKLLLEDCENLIRTGQIDVVRKKLTSVASDGAKIARPLRLPFGNLCRRTDLYSLGLKFLSPVVNLDNNKWATDATPHELSEYANLLHKSGATREALWILRQIDPAAAPEALLVSAYCYFTVWDYAIAADCLARYVTLERRSYQRLVGATNLAAALVNIDRLDEAAQIVEENLAHALAENYTRIQANTLELRAQIFLKRGNFEKARADLASAATLMSGNSALDQTFVQKWLAVIESFKTQDPRALREFRALASARKEWENVREADRLLLKLDFSTALFERLLFGTPFPAYRALVRRDHPGQSVPAIYLSGEADGPVLDLKTGKILNGPQDVRPSPKIHHVLSVLWADFYKPYTIGNLFGEIFPGEHYDFSTSLHRVHQAIYRTRKWIEESALPIVIHEDDGKYSIQASAPLGVLHPIERFETTGEATRLVELRSHFGDRLFSSAEARLVLGVSATSFTNLISAAADAGLVTKAGSGRSTKYKFS